MARKQTQKSHKFKNKLVLNQWLISLFGIDPLSDKYGPGSTKRPFHELARILRDSRLEGADVDGLHRFYHTLVNSDIFYNETHALSKGQILVYEERITQHTREINERRTRPITWKYFQWLTLLFVEIYLDRYFHDREGLLSDLNAYIDRFNAKWPEWKDIAPYTIDDLNKLCLQNATGSGKTLLMHMNLKQFRFYARQAGKESDLSRVILLTPNERLSEQHIEELQESGFGFAQRLQPKKAGSFNMVDVLEITKLADQDGPNTIATRSLGDQNLLLVDEGHRGMSGKEEGAWFTRRSELCGNGFTFEYSATFEQAVAASKSSDLEDSYAKAVIFDYSYRWFYEDGFGKDYQILNLPKTYKEVQDVYLTACLLKFYQQLRIYEEKRSEFTSFNLEKPLWVFVGSTVSKAKGGTEDEKIVATDVAQIIHFLADFLSRSTEFTAHIDSIISGTGKSTGLIDDEGNDIFASSFQYLAKVLKGGQTASDLYRDILGRLFNCMAGGQLTLTRTKGESGEVALYVGTSETPFGLINVGDAKGLCDHVEETAKQDHLQLTVNESDFSEAVFASVKDSSSPINLLIGSKKFVEGWDCWRVSTMGLMHVGKSEGAQIIQLFGRGVRLKGYEWSLKRSGHSSAPSTPKHIGDIETLNVFGIEADFMERFRQFLKDEGLPGNEKRTTITVPLNVTYDFGKKLMVIRPKRRKDGQEYDFKKDGPIPTLSVVPDYLRHNRLVSDWYPRIQTIKSRKEAVQSNKDDVRLDDTILSLLDWDSLYFELERFKREKTWHNLNISKEGARSLLHDGSWYRLFLPEARLTPEDFTGVRLLQEVATELLRRYCDRYYNYRKRDYIEPRLELRELTRDDDNIPDDKEYQLIVDADDEQLINSILKMKQEIIEDRISVFPGNSLEACIFKNHLFQPLFKALPNGRVTVLPIALNESEYQFVTDLKRWCDDHTDILKDKGMELYLLRNMSRGKGVGFFEAGNFHPDFILWVLKGGKQYIHFIEPHGLIHEGPSSEKINFHIRIKDIERRLGDPDVILNSWILSCTPFWQLKWGVSQEELEKRNVVFIDEKKYVDMVITV